MGVGVCLFCPSSPVLGRVLGAVRLEAAPGLLVLTHQSLGVTGLRLGTLLHRKRPQDSPSGADGSCWSTVDREGKVNCLRVAVSSP